MVYELRSYWIHPELLDDYLAWANDKAVPLLTATFAFRVIGFWRVEAEDGTVVGTRARKQRVGRDSRRHPDVREAHRQLQIPAFDPRLATSVAGGWALGKEARRGGCPMYVLTPERGRDEAREPEMRCGYMRWQPGQGCLAHAHPGAAEVFVIVEGAARFAVAGERRTVKAGSAVYLPPDVPHALAVAGSEPLLAFWAVMPNRVPSHIFYREDGTPYPWDPPLSGRSEPGESPFWLVSRADVWEPDIPPGVSAPSGATSRLHVLTPDVADGVWNDHLRGGYASWPVGMACEVHSHWRAGELFAFLGGACEFSSDEGTRVLPAGHTVYVGPGERHKLKSVGDVPLLMFLVVAPNHSPTHTFYAPDGSPIPRDRQRPANPVS